MNRTSFVQQADTPSSLLPTQRVLKRKCACGSKASASGECTACKKEKSGLQRKLSIGASNDPLEQEADRVADQVMAMSAHSAVSGATPSIQRFTRQSLGQSDTAPVSVDRVISSPGRPLDQLVQQDMEQRFDYDFSRVRVHTGAAAEQSAQDVSAHAYTVGHNIVFGSGRFAPRTRGGQRLLAHELTHVVQQSAPERIGLAQNNGKRGLSPVSRSLYHVGRKVDWSEPNIQTTTLGYQLQRVPDCDADYNACVSIAGENLTGDMSICAAAMVACGVAAAVACAASTVAYPVCLAIALAACSVVELACLAKARSTFNAAIIKCDRDKANCTTTTPTT